MRKSTEIGLVDGQRKTARAKTATTTVCCCFHSQFTWLINVSHFFSVVISFRLSPSRTTTAVEITFPIWQTARESRSLTKSKRPSNVPSSAACSTTNKLKRNSNNDENWFSYQFLFSFLPFCLIFLWSSLIIFKTIPVKVSFDLDFSGTAMWLRLLRSNS